jgi:hypothetical protein
MGCSISGSKNEAHRGREWLKVVFNNRATLEREQIKKWQRYSNRKNTWEHTTHLSTSLYVL